MPQRRATILLEAWFDTSDMADEAFLKLAHDACLQALDQRITLRSRTALAAADMRVAQVVVDSVVSETPKASRT